MRRRLSEYRLFFREFRTNYHTTGAILPSGRSLARALARFVAEQPAGPRRILEVGPGTGAVTSRIVAALGPEDQLDLVELNDRFVERLRDRFRWLCAAASARPNFADVRIIPQLHVIAWGLARGV